MQWSMVAAGPSLLNDTSYLTVSEYYEMAGLDQCDANRGPTWMHFYPATCAVFRGNEKNASTAFAFSSSLSMHNGFVTQTLFDGDACDGSPISLTYLNRLGCSEAGADRDRYANPANDYYEDDIIAGAHSVRYDFTTPDPVCPQGSYDAGNNGCLSCPAGTFSRADAVKCSSCPAGSYSPAFSSECFLCDAGKKN
jgi:hypothetical protein